MKQEEIANYLKHVFYAANTHAKSEIAKEITALLYDSVNGIESAKNAMKFLNELEDKQK